MPPNDLMRLAESTIDRTLTDSECQEYLFGPCPTQVDVSTDLELRQGMDNYVGAGALQHTTVTICLCNNIDLDKGLARELAMFTERTGIRVELMAVEADTALTFEPGQLHRMPDVYVFAHGITDWAHDRAIDIGRFVDPEALRSDYGEYLLSLGSAGGVGSAPPSDGSIRAVPIRTDPKGLVFYPKRAFEAAGYEIPESWDELVALSDQIVADGRTPWCFAFESGTGTGWPGTDFLESVVLRVGGADVYDAWTRGEIGFTSPAVTEAGRLANELVFEPGYVRRGPTSINDESWNSQFDHLLARDSTTEEQEPGCFMYHQAGFMMAAVSATDQIGTDIDFFSLPPISPDRPTPMVGQTHFMSALSDRPEVRVFMEFVASPEWGEHWAQERNDHFIAPNARFDMSTYGDAASDPEAAVQVRLAEAAREALQSDSFRFDASDLMPPKIGGSTFDGGPGAFWRAMVDWVDGTRTIEQAFADIDAEWARLRSAQ
jgi:alpha-glucoside transport system substrate-binding protein